MLAFHLKEIVIIFGVLAIYNEFHTSEKIRFLLKKETFFYYYYC